MPPSQAEKRPANELTNFVVGQTVLRRDKGKKWGVGTVTSVRPLKVTISMTNTHAFGWDEVRPQETANMHQNKKNKLQHECIACSSCIDSDHTGIICVQGHHICADSGCSQNFVKHILSESACDIPVKCMTCKMEVVPNTFERNCNAKQLETYYEACVMVGSVNEGEHLYRCKFCKVQISLVSSDGDSIYCCSSCKAVYCMICGERCSSIASEETMQHLTSCPAIAQLKNAIEKVIAEAGARACPGCGHRGRKDEACTHITCPVCQMRWCYVCGLQRELADGGEALHNSQWQTNSLRCPMFLHNIHAQNASWPSDPREAVDHFHHRHACWELRRTLVEFGKPVVLGRRGRPWVCGRRRQAAQEAQEEKAALDEGERQLQTLLQRIPGAIDGYSIELITSAVEPRDY